MKYIVERTSDFFGIKKPCENAIYKGKGEFGTNLWEVEINTLEDVNNLISETGQGIIFWVDRIEIYDGYRE